MTDNKNNKKDLPQQEPLYQWTFHPARGSLLVTTLLTVFLFLLLVIVYWLTQSRLFTIIGAVVLIGSMRSFYFPTVYKLYDDRVVAEYTISKAEKPWSYFRSYYAEKNGIFLSTFTRPSRMENFRGLFLKYGPADREKILDIISKKIKSVEDDSEREDVSSSSGGRPQ